MHVVSNYDWRKLTIASILTTFVIITTNTNN